MSGGLGTLRRSLWPFSWLYGGVVLVRNAMFDWGVRTVHRLPVRVVSVGNLTVGGTGKTPLIAWLVEQSRQAGLQPGVVARGYGRAEGAALNDEGMLLQQRFADLPQVQQPDRFAAGQELLLRHPEPAVDVVLLDDGFQHRRLRRDFDIVCLDCTMPFHYGLLPAGNLREPRSALRRADLAVLTRCDGRSEDELQARRERLAQLARKPLTVLASRHAVRDVLVQPDGDVEPASALQGRRVLLLSGIARPDSFAETAQSLGCEVVGELRRGDHHRHTEAELVAAARQAEAARAELLVTEKDDVKLAGSTTPRLVLRIDLEFLPEKPALSTFGLGVSSAS